jgi:septal ring factor EnvC (AmiA/AmiB activator)
MMILLRKHISIFIGFVLLVAFIASVTAQTKTNKKELEKKKEQLLREIEDTNKQLKLNAKNKNATKSQLDALTRKVKAREALISTINTQLTQLDGAITQSNDEISMLQYKMETLKKQYAAMILYAHKNQNNYQRMMFVFASDDFNQAFKRIKYLQQYSSFRKQQAANISQTQNALNQKVIDLESQKTEKSKLKQGQEVQKQTLEQEQSQQEKYLKNLSVQETALRKQLATKQAQKKKLENAIEAAIKKEIEAAKKKAASEGKKNVTKENAIAITLTPEAQKLSNNFVGNRGSLPWPVEQGTITERFGEHAHPSLKGVVIKNDGVDITTNNKAGVRTIFAGQVTAVISLPGSNNAVIVRHGEFLTVYSNLETVAVSKGEHLTTRQKIGLAGNDTETGKGMVNLQIWKGFEKLNPQLWLAKK